MKLKQLGTVIFLLISVTATAQQKEITLQEIWGGNFQMEYLDRLRSLNNGTEYSLLETDTTTDAKSIAVYSYKTGKKVRTLLDSKDLMAWKPFQVMILMQTRLR